MPAEFSKSELYLNTRERPLAGEGNVYPANREQIVLNGLGSDPGIQPTRQP